MFNMQLYKEGLRRSMFPALLFIAVMLIGAIFMPIGQIQSQMRAVANGWAQGRMTIATVPALNFTLLLSMIVMTPLMTLFQFSFLNKRHSSDFYHAIPHKRGALYVSFLLATLTWILGALWIVAGVSLLILAPFSHLVVVHMSTLIPALLQLSAGSLLIASVILVAMSVTGGIFANIVTAGLLLFLPRIILATLTTLVTSRLGFLPDEALGLLGNQSLHIPFGMLTSAMFPVRISSAFSPIIYSGVLALIYFALAFVLFQRRPSEAAGSPALNAKVQGIIRVSGAFMLCLPATAILTAGSHASGDFLALVAVYAFALFCYFAYELITTRKWKNMVKILPGVGVLIAINILFVLGVGQITNHFIRQELEPQNMQSVRMISFNERAHWGHNQPPSYETLRAREIEITDPAVIRALTDALSVQQNELRNNIDPWSPGSIFQSQAVQAVVEFETTAGRTILRNIRLPQAVANELSELLATVPEYHAAFFSMPEHPTNLWVASINSDAAAREIYALFREEAAEIDPAQWLSIQSGFGLDFDVDIIFYTSLGIDGFVGNDMFLSFYQITNLTPRTAELLFSHTNAQFLDEARLLLSDDAFLDNNNGWLYVQGLSENYLHHLDSWDSWGRGRHGDAFDLLPEILSAPNAGLDNTDLPLFRLELSGSVFDEEGDFWSWHGGTVFFRTDHPDFLDAFRIGSADADIELELPA